MSIKRLKSLPAKTKSINVESMAEPIPLEDDARDRLEQKMQELQEKNKYGVIFEDEEDLLEKEIQLRRIAKFKEDIETKTP